MSRDTIMTNIAYDTQRRCFYVTLYSGAAGTQKASRTVRCYPTLEQAIQALEDFKAGKCLEAGQPAQDLTVGRWLRYWLEQVVRPSRSASTTHGYTMIVRNHLIPGLGTVRLRELTAIQVQKYLNQKQAAGLCANTVRKHHGVLHNALEHARKQGLVEQNVVEMAVRPAATQPVHHYYDAETMQRLFQALEGSSIELAVKLAGYLGLRRSEICGLKWSHVDRYEKIITIAEARTAVNGKAVDKEPKNNSSVRRLGYSGLTDLEQILEQQWQKRLREKEAMGSRYQDQGFVLCHSGGRPFQPDYLSNRLQRLLAGKDLPYVTLHGLRHSFASIAHSQNVPLFGISKALGHSSTATTTQIYMHLFDDTHLSVVQEVGKAIGEAGRQHA